MEQRRLGRSGLQVSAVGLGCNNFGTPLDQAGTDALLARWINTPPAAREAMRVQALETFEVRYDMRKNAVTIIELFNSPDLPHKKMA